MVEITADTFNTQENIQSAGSDISPVGEYFLDMDLACSKRGELQNARPFSQLHP
jgi:hypothetical protein